MAGQKGAAKSGQGRGLLRGGSILLTHLGRMSHRPGHWNRLSLEPNRFLWAHLHAGTTFGASGGVHVCLSLDQI
jgi:cytochrome P450